jgi:glutathione S-transferase
MQLIGRRSSLFTRVPLYFAEWLAVGYEFQPIPDMTRLDSAAYADNPALKLPILRVDGQVIFGAQNICRVLVEHAEASGRGARVVWPEQLASPAARNAQELIWHAMSAQVQLVMGTVIAGLPSDNVFFAKARAGLEGSLDWLDARCDEVLVALPPRELSLLEVSLLCLVEHLLFRPTVTLQRYERLTAFAERLGSDDIGRRTAYRFDP